MHQLLLDRHDIKILTLLQKDSQISRLRLSEEVNLSAAQCYRRLKRLESSGLIEQYVAVVNLEKAGLDVSSIVMMSFSKTVENARQKVLQIIQSLDEIQECYSVSGEYDFILRINCANMRVYSDIINRKLYSKYVVSMHSYILLERLKCNRVLPLSVTG